ncbi:clostripain-related cysteine peptidase [Bradyrhizobium sp. BWA-3-5]|uniref:clostripain-related cysteine peptidase n=1 Tax=Bradyrhizobium sp. BWA-3-5 TaxID=3080013 RepID=UPI00293E9BCC|nr:clostripain-related cysteine peptidase [Bradyrhizobium sp. BWA-3-5]WOH63818.1 clostripain-related cysteine peptidase [Bradyrhizobium sp. BWA-3-5]
MLKSKIPKECFSALLLLAGFLLACPAEAATTSGHTADWTIMVFMNAKNNLEADAIANFREIANVGTTSRVNLVVEMGRPRHHYTSEAEGWSGVLRFLVKKGQTPVPSAAVADLRNAPDVSDLGSLVALNDFVNWSIDRYPATRYMLVIWNHGRGWRFQMAADASIRQIATTRPLNRSSIDALAAAAEAVPQVGGYFAISFDEDTNSLLCISDVQQTVEAASQKLNRKLDVVGFDAGLTSMIETAYAFRDCSTLMIGSEELEPAEGWDYTRPFTLLTANPAMSPLELSNQLVAAYKNRYGDLQMTTLSVIDLSKVQTAATALSAFADVISNVLTSERISIETARSNLVPYAAGMGPLISIDLPSFLERYIEATSNRTTRTYAKTALDATKRMVLTNYASRYSSLNTGSKGVAIYFPASKYDFDTDFYKQGYLKRTTDVIGFVAQERWADFLQSYFR